MAAVTTESISVRRDEIGVEPARPVLFWGTLGALFVALIVYVFAAWFISGDAKAVTTGPDKLQTATKVWAWLFQGVMLVALVWMIAYAVRKCREEGRLAFDAIFIIALGTMYWQDPLVNYLRPAFFYNSYLINLGSWVEHIPGWTSPNGRYLPEPLVFTGMTYASLIPVFAMIGCGAMRLAKRRWPGLGRVGLVGVGLLTCALLDLVLECMYIRSNLYAFAGTIHEASVWGGRRYQFPIYEALFWGGFLTTAASLRFFRDDKGRSVVERGIERIGGSSRKRDALRLLAVIGFLNLAMLIYNTAMINTTLHADAHPKGYPSYQRNHMCGEGTPYPCPSPDTPVWLRSAPPP